MIPLRAIIIIVLILGLMVILQACSESGADKLAAQAEQSRKHAAHLESQLAKTSEALARQKDENSRLARQLDSIRNKVQALEAQSEKNKTAGDQMKEAPDVGKIGLLGAKAIAEFKVEQLSKRVDKLGADLNSKDRELVKLNQLAKRKDDELTKLKDRIDKLQSTDQGRVKDLQTKFENTFKELQKRTAAANKAQQDLKDKSELLATLQNAVSDAAKLKSAAEAETKKLSAQLAQTTKQLETSNSKAAADKRDLQDCSDWAEKAANKLKQQQAAMKQYHDETEHLRKEGSLLKAALAKLEHRVKTAKAPQKHESTIDRILEAPKFGASQQAPSSNLY
jgi:chromosome segregation ATPase